MAQADRRAAAAGEFIGKDVLKSFNLNPGNISAAQLTALVSRPTQLKLIKKVGDFTADSQSSCKLYC